MKQQPFPSPEAGLAGLLHAAAQQGDLFCMDLGPRWTVLTWPAGEAIRWSWGDGSDWLARARAAGGASPRTGQPLPGGLVGWLGYEAGANFERMPAPRGARPLDDLLLWRCEGSIAWDRALDRWWVQGDPGFLRQARTLRARAGQASPFATRSSAFTPLPAPPLPPPQAASRYQDAVATALDRIRQGWVYQVNLAWEQRGPAVTDPVGAWLALRSANPAELGVLIRQGSRWVLGNSPELSLRARAQGAGGRAQTQGAGGRAQTPGAQISVHSLPIKGTASRLGPDPAAARAALLASEKERAELTMIVDLVRNDLGRVAVAGGVQYGHRRARVCGDLWHAEQGVAARLRPGLDAWDAIAATFPPGSVTGAPKVEAMRLIHELEEGPRGIYTGSVVLLGDDGELWSNVAIRTATIADGEARMHVGAGIVADSSPVAEWQETLAKARMLARHVFAG